jgi:hypothetical protein
VSTAGLGLAGVCFAFALLRQAGADRRLAALGAATLAADPLYLNLSLTFMTDVPFTAWSLGALVFLARALARETWSDLVVGMVLALAAILTRQPAVVIPVAFLAVTLATRPRDARRVARGLLPSVAGGLALATWDHWARAGGMDWTAQERMNEMLGTLSSGVRDLVTVVAWRGVIALVYVGLLSLPVLVPAAVAIWRAGGPPARRGLAGALATLVLVLVELVIDGSQMPLIGNILHDQGVGPVTLRPDLLEPLLDTPRTPPWVWSIVTGLAVLGASLLGGIAGAALAKRRRDPPPAMLLCVTTAVLYGGLLVVSDFFDRYLIVLGPLCATLVPFVAGIDIRSTIAGRRAVTVGAALAIAYGALGAAATHDYFAWNRARWAVIDDAVGRLGVPPALLDGGYEWLGLTRSADAAEWFGASRDPWVVALRPARGYREVARRPFPRLLPPGPGTILLLHREGG